MWGPPPKLWMSVQIYTATLKSVELVVFVLYLCPNHSLLIVSVHLGPAIIEGVRARVSEPSFYDSLPVCSIRTFRTYLKENRQEL